MWMLEVIDELLVQIGKYHGLVILGTNKDELLDYAIYRRLIATIDVPRPEPPERLRLWQDKMPPEFPLKPSLDQYVQLATLQLTGAEIENVIIDYASMCLRKSKRPMFSQLYDYASTNVDQRLAIEKQREELNAKAQTKQD